MNFIEKVSIRYGLQMPPEDPFLKMICLRTISFQFRLSFGQVSDKSSSTTD
jgi:hypothetical protein